MRDFFKLKKQEPSFIDKNLPFTDIQYTVLDTELTGLNEKKDSILSIGAVRMAGTRIELGNSFHQLVKPDTQFKPDSVVVHEITPSDVLKKPTIDVILSEFLQFCGSDILVGHCLSIDMSFINREMKRIYRNTIQNPLIDTYKVYEWLRKKVPTKTCFSSSPQDSSLYEIAKCFSIAVRGAHNALIDAFITAQLLQRFMPVLIDIGITTIGDLLKIGHPLEGGDTHKISSEISNF
ncbi:MAG: 3'-5' exonuclease [Thermodesulfovibrionales bacterium]|nr:3'-5' exonuclease [Thermodesulfovibrionales bacterium]